MEKQKKNIVHFSQIKFMAGYYMKPKEENAEVENGIGTNNNEIVESSHL